MVLYRSFLAFLSAVVVVDAQAPTVGPSNAPTTSPDYDICYICGYGKVVSDPNGSLLQGTCGEAELDGLAGNISHDTCQLLQSNASASAQCGCVPASEFECNVNTCTLYSSMADLKNDATLRSNICMCSTTFHPEGTVAGCTGTSEDTIMIKSDHAVTIECVDSNLECRMECPNTAFVVEGSLTLQGNGRMSLSGGISESRIVIAPRGSLTMNGVSIIETSSGFTNRRELLEGRHLHIGGSNGAGIYNDVGGMVVTNCDFSHCTAAGSGGAIWTSGTALIKMSKFKHNAALSGGAIYVDRGVVSVTKSVFEGNSATRSNDNNIFISSMAIVDSCQNEGLGSEWELCIASEGYASKRQASNGGGMSTITLVGIVLGLVLFSSMLVFGAVKWKNKHRSGIHTTIKPVVAPLSHRQQSDSDNAQCADATDASVFGYEHDEQPDIPIIDAMPILDN